MNDCESCKYKGNNAEDRCRGCWKDGAWRRWEAVDEESPWIPASKPPEVHRVPHSSPAMHLVSNPVITYCANRNPKYAMAVYVRGGPEDCGCWYTRDLDTIQPDWWMPIPEPPKEETP